MNYKQKLYKKLRKIVIFIQAELSKDDAEALINKNKKLRQLVNKHRSKLPEEIINDDKFYKYWRCREEADYLYRQTRDVNEYFWYEYKEQEDCYLFQNSGNWIENPIIRYNKYFAFTSNSNVQDTIIFSYLVNDNGSIDTNEKTICKQIKTESVLSTVFPTKDTKNIIIDGKFFIYGGTSYQEAVNSCKEFIEKLKKIDHNE